MVLVEIWLDYSKVFLMIGFKESLLMEKLLIENVYEQVYHKDLFWGLFFFQIYINDLATALKSNVKLFADDTSLFSKVSDPLETANILNKDTDKIWGVAEQWKMVFNLDPTKQAQEVLFSKNNIRELFILISTLINLWLKKCKSKSI